MSFWNILTFGYIFCSKLDFKKPDICMNFRNKFTPPETIQLIVPTTYAMRSESKSLSKLLARISIPQWPLIASIFNCLQLLEGGINK